MKKVKSGKNSQFNPIVKKLLFLGLLPFLITAAEKSSKYLFFRWFGVGDIESKIFSIFITITLIIIFILYSGKKYQISVAQDYEKVSRIVNPSIAHNLSFSICVSKNKGVANRTLVFSMDTMGITCIS